MRTGDSTTGGAPGAALLLLVAATAFVAVAATLGVLHATGALASQEEARQQEVAERGAEVMRFDL